jgi:hypothetical protein
MEATKRILIIVLVGGLMGLGSFYYIAGWYYVVAWAIASLIVGYRSDTTRNCIINGAVFGYALFLVYTYASFKDRADVSNYFHWVLFDIGFSLIGAIVGAAGGFAGFFLKDNNGKKAV